ncbi:hypothetical protein KY290_001062 [Solanum tuberosum]|uniref:Uncharacterized protein n=1 Tax=Solanum tuberosum TaxID=4113 RepID=A0ABQ7WL38_SOLTU|nr:hypothetical protein KY290_001062 [Solanum tuberosum]
MIIVLYLKALRKKVNCLIDNNDMVPPENSKMASMKENLPTQHVEELICREHDPRDNASEEVNEVIMEEHELANSTKIEQDKIDHMWDIILKRSFQNKTNRSKHSLPPHIETKSYARLRHEMRKKGKQVDAFQQDVIDQFDQFKKQQERGEISLNDDDIFVKVLGTEKNGYLLAYGPGKSISEYFGGRPTKAHLLKQLESTRKESNERVEEVKKGSKGRNEERNRQ